MIVSVDHSSLSHADNWKNNFSALDEGPITGIHGTFVSTDKKFSIKYSEVNTKFCLSLHYNGENSYLFVNGKEIFKFRSDSKNINFPTQLCLGSISNELRAIDSREIFLQGNMYDFSVDYNVINKYDILNIYIYLKAKNYVK